MLLKMVDDYMTLYDIVPQFGAEIVHRELELLKQFNSQVSHRWLMVAQGLFHVSCIHACVVVCLCGKQ
jgi:hypothetical protein